MLRRLFGLLMRRKKSPGIESWWNYKTWIRKFKRFIMAFWWTSFLYYSKFWWRTRLWTWSNWKHTRLFRIQNTVRPVRTQKIYVYSIYIYKGGHAEVLIKWFVFISRIASNCYLWSMNWKTCIVFVKENLLKKTFTCKKHMCQEKMMFAKRRLLWNC